MHAQWAKQQSKAEVQKLFKLVQSATHFHFKVVATVLDFQVWENERTVSAAVQRHYKDYATGLLLITSPFHAKEDLKPCFWLRNVKILHFQHCLLKKF